MNVVIVGPFWFPHGAANAARIRNLAAGLRDCGARVHVIAMAPQPRPDQPDGDEREFEGVTYEYAAPFAAAIDGWCDPERHIPRLRQGPLHRLRWFAGMYASTPGAWQRLRRRIDRGECDLVVVYDRSAVRMTPLVGLCRRRGIPAVLDVVEVSEHLAARASALYWDYVVGTRVVPRLFDGLTVITAGLEDLYRVRGCPRTLVVPSLESWPPAPFPVPTGHLAFRLTYVGALLPRDAPELLFDALRLLARERPPITLDVIGHYEGTARGRHFLRVCTEDPELRRVVRFLGRLGDTELAKHLAASDGLVLTRRAARAEALAFPTRLVEYLRHGRPVFVSDVGDVARYLRDGDEAVLLDPGAPSRIARAIAAVAARPDRGAEIGRRGREAGSRAFDRKVHAGRLLEFAAGLAVPRAS
jgi:glycosyltransferase involved in cell wall biosynthesis